MKSQNFEAGLSDCHKLARSILRTSFKKLPPKTVYNIYRYQKYFDPKKFLHDLDSQLLQRDLYRNCNEPHEKLSENFTDILNHHAPMNEK